MTLTAIQQQDRMSYMGGSDAAIFFTPGGLYGRTKTDIYLRLVNGELHIEDSPRDRTYWGSALESTILEAFQESTGHEIYRPHAANRMHSNPKLGALLDGYIFAENAVVEAKNRGIEYRKAYDETGGSLVPEKDRIQVNWQMMVTGPQCQYSYLIVLIGGNDFRWLRIERDQRLIDHMYEDASNFITNNVEKRIPPDPEIAADCDKIWPREDPDKDAVVTDQQRVIDCNVYHNLKEQEKFIKKKLDDRKRSIKSYMTDRNTLISPVGDRLATWSRPSGKRQRFVVYENI